MVTNISIIICSFFVLSVIVPEAVLQNATTKSSVGKACTSNSTCNGPNEYCQFITWLSPSCKTGICQCLPCHTAGDFAGYVAYPSSSSVCRPIQQLNVGDPCTGAYDEVIVAPNAACVSGIVTTYSSNGFTEYSSCRYYSDCAGAMNCTLDPTIMDYTCQCPNSNEKYCPSNGRCIKKEFGDPCVSDTDCQVNGTVWEGFTSNIGTCVANRCACGGNTTTFVGYMDPILGVFTYKAICLENGAKVDVPINGSCNVDPVGDGYSSSVRVCSSDSLCFACPEDNSSTIGKCRKPVGKRPIPACCKIVKPVFKDKSYDFIFYG